MTFRDVYGIISARGNAEIGKNPCTFVFMGAVKMYKYRSKQISLTDFNTPVGMKLNPDNRWVKKAELIPCINDIIKVHKNYQIKVHSFKK